MKIDVNKSPGKNLELMAIGLCYVIDGLTMLLTFGLIQPRAFLWFVRVSTPLVTSRKRRKTSNKFTH